MMLGDSYPATSGKDDRHMLNTYVTSDIHGCLSQLRRLLDEASPSDDDVVWVLGDICDRGPESAESLWWAVEEAPANVRFLLGNHETFAREVFCEAPELWEPMCDRGWWINGGTETLLSVTDAYGTGWVMERLCPWLRGLRPYELVEDGLGRPWALVHAGFDTRAWDAGSSGPVMFERPSVTFDVGGGFGTQDETVMTWVREGWYDYPGECPMPVVYGHTPTNLVCEHALHHGAVQGDSLWFERVPAEGRIWHFRDRHNVDCGCVYGGHLGMMRLEDGEEFYADGLPRR